ncbi:MAG: hypothetical protein ACRDHG_00480 [Anaerolineales bacterium]
MRIREALPTDSPAIAKVHVDSWRSTYRGIISDRGFYEAMGGRRLGGQQIQIGPDSLGEVAYGWENLDELRNRG